MISKFRSSGIIIAIIIALLLVMSAFTVDETQRALVLRLGKIVTDSERQPVVYGPGLHFKIPLISTVVKFDRRLETLDIQDSRVMTNDKKDVIVSSFVKWRISNFAEFYKSTTGDRFKAERLLEQRVGDVLRAEFGKRGISEVVSGERMDIMEILRQDLNKSAANLGINVVDVRIKRIELPTEVSESVYSRMRAEREQAAASHRANGEREAEIIRARADAQRIIITAEAEKEANTIKGQGDSKAAQIYAQTFNKDPEFFSFYQSLQTYMKVFNDKSDLLVLQPNSDFFKYFNRSSEK
jgi:membrane protease subunit HflC